MHALWNRSRIKTQMLVAKGGGKVPADAENQPLVYPRYQTQIFKQFISPCQRKSDFKIANLSCCKIHLNLQCRDSITLISCFSFCKAKQNNKEQVSWCPYKVGDLEFSFWLCDLAAFHRHPPSSCAYMPRACIYFHLFLGFQVFIPLCNRNVWFCT